MNLKPKQYKTKQYNAKQLLAFERMVQERQAGIRAEMEHQLSMLQKGYISPRNRPFFEEKLGLNQVRQNRAEGALQRQHAQCENSSNRHTLTNSF